MSGLQTGTVCASCDWTNRPEVGRIASAGRGVCFVVYNLQSPPVTSFTRLHHRRRAHAGGTVTVQSLNTNNTTSFWERSVHRYGNQKWSKMVRNLHLSLLTTGKTFPDAFGLKVWNVDSSGDFILKGSISCVMRHKAFCYLGETQQLNNTLRNSVNSHYEPGELRRFVKRVKGRLDHCFPFQTIVQSWWCNQRFDLYRHNWLKMYITLFKDQDDWVILFLDKNIIDCLLF